MGKLESREAPFNTSYGVPAEEDPTLTLTPFQLWKRNHASGWRFGVTAGAACAAAVFITNVLIFIWAESRNGFPGIEYEGGKHVMYDGNCDKTRNLNIGAHLMINILSTLLLSASNYCMQCMSAPTRKEVDEAHAGRKWLDIGIQSLRNVSKIEKKRGVLYCLLAFSSIPLHLFYNSTVFSSIAAHEYFIYSVNDLFANPNTLTFIGQGYSKVRESNFSSIQVSQQLFNQARNGSLKRLEPLECLNAYARPFQTTWGSVLFVVPPTSKGFTPDKAVLWYEEKESLPTSNSGISQGWPFQWICRVDGGSNSEQCQNRISPKQKDIANWKPFDKEILYCLAEPVEEHCRLLYSAHLAIIVVLLNLFKVLLMLYIAFGIKESPLMTMGDAVSSFLQQPDETTKSMCLLSKADVKSRLGNGTGWSTNPVAKRYNKNRRLRFAAASGTRWFLCTLLFTIAIGTVMGLLAWGVSEIVGPKSPRSLLSLGLGAINPSTFIRWKLPSNGASAILSNVLVANAPQFILSLLYFAYNGLFTSMSLATEWATKAVSFKGLRVSSRPLGAQRSTYFLQLPYSFALPLMLTSGTLHWLISQSIFLVSVDAYMLMSHSSISRVEESDYMTCGFSPVAMVSVSVVGMLMMLAAFVSGAVSLPSGMPVAGSCSAAIAAACHPEGSGEERSEMAFRSVRWGAVPSGMGEVGHCSFTSREVEEPAHGHLYAGFDIRKNARR